jgi:hypothetical protein
MRPVKARTYQTSHSLEEVPQVLYDSVLILSNYDLWITSQFEMQYVAVEILRPFFL